MFNAQYWRVGRCRGGAGEECGCAVRQGAYLAAGAECPPQQLIMEPLQVGRGGCRGSPLHHGQGAAPPAAVFTWARQVLVGNWQEWSRVFISNCLLSARRPARRSLKLRRGNSQDEETPARDPLPSVAVSADTPSSDVFYHRYNWSIHA